MFVYSAKGNAERARQLKCSHLNLLAQQGRLNHSSDTKNKISHWYKPSIFISYHVFTMYQLKKVLKHHQIFSSNQPHLHPKAYLSNPAKTLVCYWCDHDCWILNCTVFICEWAESKLLSAVRYVSIL